MDFGLGLVLSFTDNATAGINNAVNSLNQLTRTAENASTSLNQMASLSALSVVSDQLGSSFMKAGNSILSVFGNLLGHVQNTGSEFENFRITLNALYGDAEMAENAISKLLDFSIKSPFEVDEVKDMLIVLQSQSIDAFSEITGGISGARQETLSWIADLMAFKPDEATSRWKRALTNYLGSGEDRMLRNILDMGDIDDILGHDIGATAEERMNDIVEIIEKKNLVGLAENLSFTWQGVASNIGDAFTKLYKSIADNGVFEKLKMSFMGVAGAILALDNEQIEAFGKTIAEGLNLILTPVTYVAEKLNGLITTVVNLCQTNPKIVKWGMVFGAIVGVMLVVIGVVLKFTSALSGLSLIILATGNTFSSIGGLFKIGALKMLSTLVPLIATIGLLALAWKSDFAGIRTNTTYFVNNLVNSFKTARQAVNGNVTELITTLTNLRSKGDFFSNITIGIMKVMMFFKALADAWNDYELSEENFKKAEALGILPLISAILDLKYRFEFFKQGFIDGWRNISNKVVKFISGIANSLDGTIFETMLDGITKFMQKLSDNDPQSWKDFGVIIGELSAKFLLVGVALKVFDSIGGKIWKVITFFTSLGGVVGKIASAFGKLGGGICKVLKNTFPFIHKTLEKGLQTIFKSNIRGIIPHIKIWFAGVQDAIIGAITGIATALGAPVWAVVTAIIAILSTVFIYAVKNWEEFKSKIISIWTTIKDESLAIWESFKNGISSVIENLKNAVTPVINAFNNLKGKFSELVQVLGQNQQIQNIINLLSNIGKTIVNTVVPILKTVVRVVSSALQGVWNILVTTFNSIVNIVSSVLTEVMNIIGGVIDVIVGLFTLDLFKILEGVETIFKSVINVVTTILSSLGEIVSSIFKAIVDVVYDIFVGIFDTLQGAFMGVVGILQSVFKIIVDHIVSVFKAIYDILATFATWVYDNVIKPTADFFVNLWDGIVEGVVNGFKAVMDFFSGVASWIDTNVVQPIVTFFSNLWDGIVNGVTSAINAVKTFLGNVASWVYGNIIQPIVNFFMAYIYPFIEKIVEIVGKIIEIVTVLVGVGINYLVQAVKNFVQNVINTVQNIVSWISTNIIKPIANFFVNLWNGIVLGVTNAITAIKNFFSNAVNWISTSVVQPITNFFVGLWNGLVLGVTNALNAIQNFFSMVVSWVNTNVVQPMAQFFVGLWNSIVMGVQAFISSATAIIGTITSWINSNIIQPIASFFTNLWNGIVNGITSFIASIITAFTNMITNIKNFFSSLPTFFQGVWDNIVGIFTTIGTAVSNAISGAVKGAINTVLKGAGGIINGFISAINGVIGIINKIPGVSISTVTPMNIPQLAKGGVVENPTMALVGEAGTEAVMPLENNTGWIGVLAEMITTKMSNMQPTNTSQMTTNNNNDNTSNEYLTNNSTNNKYLTNNTNNTSNEYLTRNDNSTSNTYGGNIDNSVVFNQGAIQINVQNANEEEAMRMAQKIMEYIKRQQQLDKMTSYA